MRLCIIQTSDGATTALRVDGELLSQGARELERVAGAFHPLRLDLTYLIRADADGLAALRRLAAVGAELVNVPPYFALLLTHGAGKREAPPDPA